MAFAFGDDSSVFDDFMTEKTFLYTLYQQQSIMGNPKWRSAKRRKKTRKKIGRVEQLPVFIVYANSNGIVGNPRKLTES